MSCPFELPCTMSKHGREGDVSWGSGANVDYLRALHNIALTQWVNCMRACSAVGPSPVSSYARCVCIAEYDGMS